MYKPLRFGLRDGLSFIACTIQTTWSVCFVDASLDWNLNGFVYNHRDKTNIRTNIRTIQRHRTHSKQHKTRTITYYIINYQHVNITYNKKINKLNLSREQGNKADSSSKNLHNMQSTVYRKFNPSSWGNEHAIKNRSTEKERNNMKFVPGFVVCM